MLLWLVGVFELVAWGLDPLGVHSALNDGEPLNLFGRIAAAGVNSGILFASAVVLRRRYPMWCSVLFPVVAMFTWNQWTFWWFPYLLGDVSGTVEMVQEHKAQLRHLPRILPPNSDHLVPDIEHTVLMPLSVLAFFQSVVQFRKLGSQLKTKHYLVLVVVTALLSGLQLIFVLKDPVLAYGPALTCALIASSGALVGCLAYSASESKRE